MSVTPDTPASVGPRHQERRSRWRGRLTIIGFLSPALILFCVLVLAPILLAGYASLFRWNGFGGLPDDFVGLDNFRRLLDDQIFLDDLQHAAVLIILGLVIQLPFALGLAVLLNQNLRGRAIYRLLFFVPYVFSEVITAVLFTSVLSPNQGLATQLLEKMGFGEDAGTWLGDPNTVIYAVFFVMTWKYFGFYMILFLAGIQDIPMELGEAAALDGAGSWRKFRHITLPLLGPTIRTSIFLSILGTLQLFDMVWVFTGGGPVHASETMAVTMFQYGFRRFEVGYASAISVAMFLLSFVFALFYQRFVMRRDTEGAVTTMRGKR